MTKEIERQFAILSDLQEANLTTRLTNYIEYITKSPECSDVSISIRFSEDQYQSYLYPDTNPMQVRIRKIETSHTVRYYLTLKGDYETPTSRTEVEFRISEEEYTSILDIIGKEPIHKQCIDVEINGVAIRFAIVDPGKPEGFAFAEAEFATEEDAAAFIWPFDDIAIAEVTGSNNANAGNTMSMPQYWKTYRLGLKP